MAKNNLVYREVIFENSLENDISIESITICQFCIFSALTVIQINIIPFLYKQSLYFKYSASGIITMFIV